MQIKGGNFPFAMAHRSCIGLKVKTCEVSRGTASRGLFRFYAHDVCAKVYIGAQCAGVAGNGATTYFLVFAILAGVIGIASKFAGANHIRAWRNDSLAAAASSALVAWAVTALAFGLACKEIAIGGYRGWRLRVLEAFVIILAFTQLLYVQLLHAGIFSSKYGPGYRDTDYGVGTAAGVDPAQKGGAGLGGTRV